VRGLVAPPLFLGDLVDFLGGIDYRAIDVLTWGKIYKMSSNVIL
jgi:hypothetical protein